MSDTIDPWLLSQLCCPRDQSALTSAGHELRCEAGHGYPVVQGVPVLLRDDVPQTIGIAEASLRAARMPVASDDPAASYYIETLGISEDEKAGVVAAIAKGSAVDPVVTFLIGATNGLLYKDVIGSLERLPIPVLRLPSGEGRTLLDIGCSWGRWSIAAARKGYRTIGVDPSLGAALTARRLCARQRLDAHFCVADGRYLPFARDSVDVAFSYSVLQHLSIDDVERVLESLQRVLRPGGEALVQMPNRLGLRCLYHQARRGFRPPRDFEVRYWALPELVSTFERKLGPAELSVDCYFGLGLQPSDAPLMPPKVRVLLTASELLRHASERLPRLAQVADSVYVRAINRA